MKDLDLSFRKELIEEKEMLKAKIKSAKAIVDVKDLKQIWGNIVDSGNRF